MDDQAAADEDGNSEEPQAGDPLFKCLVTNPSIPDVSWMRTCCV